MSNKPNPERDAEIKAMAADGCTNSQIAAHFGISENRVWQIKRGRDRSNERKDATHPVVIAQDRAPDGIKPRLKRTQQGHWSCCGAGLARTALTHQAAYQRWLTAILLASARYRVPARPPAVAVNPVSQPKSVEKVAAFTPLVDVKSIRKGPNGRGKSMEAVKPRASAPKVVVDEPVAPYAGSVTVLPGSAHRRPLSLSMTLQLNAARAAAVQPKLVSIAGSAAREVA